MVELGSLARLRRALPQDEAFLFAVFSTTWEHAVASMPNPQLVQHFLRIQYTAQERRFDVRFPTLERWVVMSGDVAAGRLYLHDTPSVMHVVDMSLLPQFRSQGIGAALLHEVLAQAESHKQTVSLRVARHNSRAAHLYEACGFRLVTTDDLDSYYEWTPPGP